VNEVFKPGDFRAVRLLQGDGEVFYFGSPTEEVREQMAQNANLTLEHVVGSGRFDAEEWAALRILWMERAERVKEDDEDA
jgi:hypothetical protein